MNEAGDGSTTPAPAPGGRGRGRGRQTRPPEPPFEDVARQLGETQEAHDTLMEQHLRLAADFDNFRRRNRQESEDRARYASEDAARALLPVLDNLRRALDTAGPGADQGLADGVRMIVRDLDAALERIGVTAVDAVGQPFNPACHEAVMAEESDAVEVDTVVLELQRGYRLHDRVIRPAMVKVAQPARQGAAPAAE